MREVKFWEFLAKVYFNYFEEVQLNAMGRAINLAVRASDNIIDKELGEYQLLETFVAEEETKTKKKQQLKPSIRIVLKRVLDFEQKLSQLEKFQKSCQNAPVLIKKVIKEHKSN